MLDILFEDNHLLVVNKPAGWVTQGAAEGESSLVELSKSYLKRRYAKPGNVYLGVVSRLDRLATGVLVFARTSKAAARLNDQFRERLVSKTYWVLVPRGFKPPAGELQDHVRKDDAIQRVIVCAPQHPQAREARLTYRTLSPRESCATMLEIDLETGRKHQIRVQLAHRGFPVLGDRKYGSDVDFGKSIALHSAMLSLSHPTTKLPMSFSAPIPANWENYVDRAVAPRSHWTNFERDA